MAKARTRDSLTPRQLTFVQNYLATGNAKQAAHAAGYSPKNSYQTGSQLLKSPLIKAEIEKAQENLREKIGFTLEKAYEYAEEDRRFAREKNNATAAHKSTELMSRLSGHLIEKHEHKIDQQISIRAAIDAGNGRIVDILKNVTPMPLSPGKANEKNDDDESRES